MSNFWNQFYQLCKNVDLRPTALGSKLNISSGTINNWKNGTIPNGETLLKLADFFDVSVDYLLGRENASSNSNSITNNGNVISSTQSNNIVNSSDETKFDTTTTQVAEAFSNLSFSDKAKVMGLVAELEEQQKKKA